LRKNGFIQRIGSDSLRQPRPLRRYFLQFLRWQVDKNRFREKFEMLNEILQFDCRFYRAMLCIRGTSHGPVSVCVRLCPSLTRRSSTKTAKRRTTQITPHDTPESLVFWCQRSPRNSTGVTPYEGAECRWGGQNRHFRQITGCISKTLKDRHIVSIKVE